MRIIGGYMKMGKKLLIKEFLDRLPIFYGYKGKQRGE